METRSAKGWDRRLGTLLPTHGRSTIDSPVVPLPPITLTYNHVHFIHGVIWDDDFTERLMIVFEKTHIQINQRDLSAAQQNEIWGTL
jgi:hypothetical protein